MNALLVQAAVYLTAALIVVPIARKLGLGSVLGYLLAGLAVGPAALGLVGDTTEVMHAAEFGVVMMLFLVGLELEPEKLWRLRWPILGLGGAQVLLTAALAAAIGTIAGVPLAQAVAIGLIIAMSSTAIALQSLAERGTLGSAAGQNAFSVLLFQDIAVIPMLAFFPLLATLPLPESHEAGHGADYLANLSPLAHGAVSLAAIAAVILFGRYGVGFLLRRVARSGLRELFTAAALLLVVGVTVLMTFVGLSPALGTFLAGVVLANSEYRHELESDVEPFKGLLLGLFFMAVGASLDMSILTSHPLRLLALVLGAIAIKATVLAVLGRALSLSKPQILRFVAALSQVGEFAFVLLTLTLSAGILPQELVREGLAVVALSMAISPFLMAGAESLIARDARKHVREDKPADHMDEHAPVIIAGYGRFGQIAGRLLRGTGTSVTVLDIDDDQVAIVRKFGQQVFYGDASRLDLLRAAGAHHAKVLIVAVDVHEKAIEIVHTAQKHFPNLKILSRARGRTEAYDLIELGVQPFRETFDTALRTGQETLVALGMHPHRAHRIARHFARFDERSMYEMAAMLDDDDLRVRTARERIAEFERTLRNDEAHEPDATDTSWNDAPMREAARDTA